MSDSGTRWLYPTGRSGFTIAGGRGTIQQPGTPRNRLITLDKKLRDTAVELSFGLEGSARGPAPKAVVLARKSAAGEYRFGVRVGNAGKVRLSVSRVRPGRPAKSLANRVVSDWRYQPGDRIKVVAQAIKRDPTQLRMKVWRAGTARPAGWQLVLNDRGADIAAGGRVGLLSLPAGKPKPSVALHFDDVVVRRASGAKQAPPSSKTSPAPKSEEPKDTVQKQKQAPKPTPKPPTGGKRVHVPKSIDATGSKNVSGALQKFVDGVPNGSTVVFPAGAVYRLGGWGIRVNDKHNVTFEGNGTTLRAVGGCEQWNSPFAVGVAKPSSNITIHGFKLRGHNPAPGGHAVGCQHEHGVAVHGSTDILIHDVDIRNVYGDCLYVGEHTWPNRITFRDSTCTGAGRMGVAIVRGRNVTVERVAFDNIAIHVFDIEPNHADEGAINATFRNNTVGSFNQCNCFGGAFFAANGNLDALVRNIEVSGNRVTGGSLKTLVGDEFFGWSGGRQHRDIRFTNNRSTVKAKGPVLVFKHVDGLVISGNVQPLSSGQLVKLVDAVNVKYPG